jgi:hypothetical protein
MTSLIINQKQAKNVQRMCKMLKSGENGVTDFG